MDVRDAAAVDGDCSQDVRRDVRPGRGLVHGAGVLADRRIEDQTDEQFDHVYATKVDRPAEPARRDRAATAQGARPVLLVHRAVRPGRQVAYAAANEVLNKTAQRPTARRPGCRVVAVNWGPWDGGMVTPGPGPGVRAEGIGLIPLADGRRDLLRELAASDRPAEVVVLARPAPGR